MSPSSKRHMVVSSSDMSSQCKKHSWLSPIGLSSSARCPAHLHLHRCAVALIFDFASLCSSSWLHCCTHFIIAPSSAPSSLRHRMHKLHRCTITRFNSQFIVAPSRLRAHILFWSLFGSALMHACIFSSFSNHRSQIFILLALLIIAMPPSLLLLCEQFHLCAIAC